MSNIIQISSVPTLTDLYKKGAPGLTLNAPTSFQPSSDLNSRISIIRASITDIAATSIVNAANESLLGGGGIDGVIHRAAGPDLLNECRTLGGCETGSAKITKAYNLPSEHVIHTVGPRYYYARRERPGLEVELLRSCYKTSLDLAKEKGGSIVFNCVSTGIYGYPSMDAALVACNEVRRWLSEEGQGSLERVVFCVFELKDERAYNELLPRIFPPAPAPPSPAAQAIPEAAEEQDGMTVSTIMGSEKATKASRGSETDDWEAVSGAEAEEADKVDLVVDDFSVVEGSKKA